MDSVASTSDEIVIMFNIVNDQTFKIENIKATISRCITLLTNGLETYFRDRLRDKPHKRFKVVFGESMERLIVRKFDDKIVVNIIFDSTANIKTTGRAIDTHNIVILMPTAMFVSLPIEFLFSARLDGRHPVLMPIEGRRAMGMFLGVLGHEIIHILGGYHSRYGIMSGRMDVYDNTDVEDFRVLKLASIIDDTSLNILAVSGCFHRERSMQVTFSIGYDGAEVEYSLFEMDFKNFYPAIDFEVKKMKPVIYVTSEVEVYQFVLMTNEAYISSHYGNANRYGRNCSRIRIEVDPKTKKLVLLLKDFRAIVINITFEI